MMEQAFDIEEELKKLPAQPGVYIMHDAKDNPYNRAKQADVPNTAQYNRYNPQYHGGNRHPLPAVSIRLRVLVIHRRLVISKSFAHNTILHS